MALQICKEKTLNLDAKTQSSPDLLLAPCPPHPASCQARSTASPPGTSPLGVVQREHVVSEPEDLFVGAMAWKNTTLCPQHSRQGGSDCPTVLESGDWTNLCLLSVVGGKLPEWWSGCPSACIVDGEFADEESLQARAASAASSDPEVAVASAATPSSPSPPRPAERSSSRAWPLQRKRRHLLGGFTVGQMHIYFHHGSITRHPPATIWCRAMTPR